MNGNNDLLIVYKKNSEMSSVISQMMEDKEMKQRIVNKKIYTDTLGDYSMIYSDDTNIEDITDTLKKECLGENK